ncbi:M56 family metallopeptidase [Desulfitobacterium hafniense]|uniref:M56 family metallopeptidase n=1 Tax=Desulfitobacterium hafniense TaxID=49338 RepID=UPI00036C37A9|nr:M56 family metallopeptidase [Desulfitobacterium hafniense]
MALDIFTVSLTMSAGIAVLLLISPFIHKRYGARWCCLAWLILALRLLIPFSFGLPDAPLHIPAPSSPTVTLKQGESPGLMLTGGSPEQSSSADGSAGSAVTGAEPASEPASLSGSYIPYITLGNLLFGIWALGAAAFFLFHICGYLIFRRRIRPYCRAAAQTELDAVLKQMKIKGRPGLFRCPNISGPMLTGFFRPAVLLPDLDYTQEELSVILRHELTHYRRGDIWYKLLLLAANSLHWFNPLVYVMRRAACRDLEYACDDLVVKNSSLEVRKHYSFIILKSMQNGQAPALTTGFSGSGNDAKKRFANILNRSSRKNGIGILALVLALTVAGSTLVACGNGQSGPTGDNREGPAAGQETVQPQPDNRAEALYSYKGTDRGDNSKVGAIIQALDYTGLQVKSFELQTDSEPYVITVNYLVDSRVDYRSHSYTDIHTALKKTAAVMFSLIPNAGDISFRLYDPYGTFAGSYYSREHLSEQPGLESFTDATVKAATDSLESFAAYLDKVAALQNTEDVYSEEQKETVEREEQIYTMIGDDREISVNSGVGFTVEITDEFAANPPLKELEGQKGALAQHAGQKLNFLIYDIRNYKTDDMTSYLFAFDGADLVVDADLKTAAAWQNAVQILRGLE